MGNLEDPPSFLSLLSCFLSFVSRYIFTCSLSGLQLGIHLKHIYNGARAKSASDYHRQIKPPDVWRQEQAGKDRDRKQLLRSAHRGSTSARGLPLLTDQPRPLLRNCPATYFRRVYGWRSHTQCNSASETSWRVCKRSGEGHPSFLSPTHREQHSCSRMKNILLFKE